MITRILTCQKVIEDVYTHFKGGILDRIGVIMGIAPAVGDIGFVGVQHQDAAGVIQYCQGLGAFVIMLVNLGGTLGKGVVAMEQWVLGRQLHQLIFGVEKRQLTADGCIHAIVIIDIQKPPFAR